MQVGNPVKHKDAAVCFDLLPAPPLTFLRPIGATDDKGPNDNADCNVSSSSDETEDHVDVQEDDPSFHDSFFSEASVESLENDMG